MREKTLIVGLVAVASIASIGVIAAQHRATVGPASHAGARHPFQFLHQTCAGGGVHDDATQGHLVQALGLTAAQTAEIDGVAVEACAAITRIHERMLAILTPEQRARIEAMHGGAHGGEMTEWFRNLHGR